MTAERTPIEPGDIRAGDLIREEYAASWPTDLGTERFAVEYRATHESHTLALSEATAHYLLNRPKPPVELPDTPTLGWATWASGCRHSGEPILAVWKLHGPADSSDGDLRQVDSVGKSSGGDPSTIRSFTPATAVPTEALRELSRAVESDQEGVASDLMVVRAAWDFIEATGATS